MAIAMATSCVKSFCALLMKGRRANSCRYAILNAFKAVVRFVDSVSGRASYGYRNGNLMRQIVLRLVDEG